MLTLFKQSIPNQYYIKLDIDRDEDDSLSAYNLISVSVIETMMSSTPYLNIKFIDPVSETLYQLPILPDDVFVVTYGRDKETSESSRFRFSTMKYESLNGRQLESSLISADLIHEKWDKMFKKTQSMSWSNSLYSDVVEDIVSEFEFEEVDIEKTRGSETVIQPMWNTSTFLKWLAANSINGEGIGGYVYYITLDNKFAFTTFDSLYKKEPKRTVAYTTNVDEGDGFNYLTVKNSYMPTLVDGGFGITSDYFDYETKEFKNAQKSITDINERQLSDWYYLAEGDNDNAFYLYGGRNPHTEDIVQNKILNKTNSVHKIELFVVGDSDLHVGDIIETVVPVPKKVQESALINDVFSGNWLIWKVAHLFDSDSGEYTSHLFLSRNGINGKDLVGLTKTNKGKVVS